MGIFNKKEVGDLVACGMRKWIDVGDIRVVEFTKQGNFVILTGIGWQLTVSEKDFDSLELFEDWKAWLCKEKGIKR